MKLNNSKITFFLFFIAIFLLEGLGIKDGREISYYLILLMPVFLLFASFIKKKVFSPKQPILLPKKMTIFFLLFLSLSAVSTALSVNIPTSFKQFLLYLALFLIFIYFYNNKKLEKPIIISIFVFSYLFSIYSLFVNFLTEKIPLLTIYSSYNLVSAGLRAHNQLGSLLILPLTISFYFLLTKKKNKLLKRLSLFSIVFFTPFFIFSYSRTAYLTLLLSFAIIGFYFVKKRKIVFSLRQAALAILILSLTLFFFIATVEESKKIPIVGSINQTLSKELNLKYKTLLSRREAYFGQALLAVRDKPAFGLGPGNFYYSSRKYSYTLLERAIASHNLFLEIFSENGLLAGFIFLIIVYRFFALGRRPLLNFSLLATLFIFQTDYTFEIYPVILLFFMLAGLTYQEKSQINGDNLIIILSTVMLVFLNLIFASEIMLKARNYEAALRIFPLNYKVYKPVIEYQLGKKNYSQGFFYLDLYAKLAKADVAMLDYQADAYLRYEDKEKALSALKQAYFWDPYNPGGRFGRIYDLEKEVYGEQSAMKFASSHLALVEKIKIKDWWSEEIINEAETFCQEIYEKCPYIFVK